MRLTVRIVVFALLAAIVAAPLLARVSSPAALGIYAALSWVCHQRPDRSWHLAGFPLAVCVRCLGIYAGALAGSILGLRFSRRLLLLSLALLGADWLGEAAGWLGPRPMARFAVGLMVGCVLVSALAGEHRAAGLRTLGMRREAQT